MPELPEVETIKRQLEKEIIGKKIADIKIKLPKIIKAPLKEFKRAVLGFKIINVKRRAKLIIIGLSSGYSLLIHLKMTGQIIYQKNCHPERSEGSHRQNNFSKQKILRGVYPELYRRAQNDISKQARIIYHFTDGSILLHNDLRKFGYVKLIKTDKVGDILKEKYGHEPLNKNFTFSVFKRLLKNKPRQKRKFSLKKISFRPNGRKIKQFLMDQKIIAGIGNIYAGEICFFAGVRPTRIINTLKENEIKKIFTGIKKILADAIKFRGSSINNYLDSHGRAGEYHLRLKVYGRAGQPCKKCGTKVEKIKLASRGTHFCPKCQK